MGGRAVEGARLESAYTSKAYRGFESHPIRHYAEVRYDASCYESARWKRPKLCALPLEPDGCQFRANPGASIARQIVSVWCVRFDGGIARGITPLA